MRCKRLSLHITMRMVFSTSIQFFFSGDVKFAVWIQLYLKVTTITNHEGSEKNKTFSVFRSSFLMISCFYKFFQCGLFWIWICKCVFHFVTYTYVDFQSLEIVVFTTTLLRVRLTSDNLSVKVLVVENFGCNLVQVLECIGWPPMRAVLSCQLTVHFTKGMRSWSENVLKSMCVPN